MTAHADYYLLDVFTDRLFAGNPLAAEQDESGMFISIAGQAVIVGRGSLQIR